MIETPQDMRCLVSELSSATLTLSTLAVLFESGLVDDLREPRTLDELAAPRTWLGRTRIERCLALAAAHGVVVVDGDRYRLAPGVAAATQPAMRHAVIADMRAPLLQSLAFLDGVARKEPSTGWRHTDPAILQTQGDTSASLAMAFKMMIVPQLGDLGERLGKPGARFLDVGVGVASLAIAVCRTFPELHVVGVDAYDVPLALARENVARAGLGDRIELRHHEIERLTDEAAYELAWLPSFFIAPSVLPAAAARVHAAVKPGGWIVLGTFGGPGKMGATLALLADLWGGPSMTGSEAETVLTAAGFANVRILPGPGGASLLVGQRT
jgi:SAM-dependent methyltransferase